MLESKRRRLESKGWKVGSAAEFLGLSADEALFVELKVTLSRLLGSVRRGRNLTQTQVAKLVQSSQSRVAKMESGDPTVSVDLLVRSLLALGATAKELGHAISHVKPINSGSPSNPRRRPLRNRRQSAASGRTRQRAA